MSYSNARPKLFDLKKALNRNSSNKIFVNKKSYSYNKYGNKTSVVNGIPFDSKLEAAYYNELLLRQKAKEIKTITPQYRLDLRVNDIHIAWYYVDFMIELTNGELEYHEVKGMETDVWKIKWKLSKALFPNNKFVLIK
jgi:hypothetical protein